MNAGRSDLHDLGSRREVPLVPKYGQGDSGLHLFAQEELKSTYLEWLKANDLTDRTSIPPGADFSSFSLFARGLESCSGTQKTDWRHQRQALPAPKLND